mgnify:CR=1 FL=1
MMIEILIAEDDPSIANLIRTVLNGAGEVAVRAFLEGRITFPAIADTIQDALCSFAREDVCSYAQLAQTDARARAHAHAFIYGSSVS